MNYLDSGDSPYNPPSGGSTVFAPTAGAGLNAINPWLQARMGTASGPTAPGAQPTAPGSISMPGDSPDYGGLIKGDPGYMAAQANATKTQADAAAQRKQRLQQAIIQYGDLPAGFADQYGDLGAETQALAKNNQFSVLANLAKNYDKSQEQFRRGLASRGALQSGDLNYGADQLDQAYGQQRYDAANQVGNSLNDALGSYTGVLNSNQQNLAGAISGAEANVYSNPAYRPTPATNANYDAANSAAYGQPIYVDDSGNQYDSNGNPFRPGGGAAPAAPAAPEGPTAPDFFAPLADSNLASLYGGRGGF